MIVAVTDNNFTELDQKVEELVRELVDTVPPEYEGVLKQNGCDVESYSSLLGQAKADFLIALDTLKQDMGEDYAQAEQGVTGLLDMLSMSGADVQNFDRQLQDLKKAADDERAATLILPGKEDKSKEKKEILEKVLIQL